MTTDIAKAENNESELCMEEATSEKYICLSEMSSASRGESSAVFKYSE